MGLHEAAEDPGDAEVGLVRADAAQVVFFEKVVFEGEGEETGDTADVSDEGAEAAEGER